MHSNKKRNGHDKSRRWHRIRTVRQREGVSLKTIARRSGLGTRVLRAQEDETNDIRLSELYAWQRALRIPVKELVFDADEAIEERLRQRACLIRVTKTAKSILREAKCDAVKNLAQTLLDQIYEVMPEAESVGAWNEVGQRRSPQDIPRVVERTVLTGQLGLWRMLDEPSTYHACDY